MIEGEEEIGKKHLGHFARQKKLLAGDVILVSDTTIIDNKTPSICVGLRGLLTHCNRCQQRDTRSLWRSCCQPIAGIEDMLVKRKNGKNCHSRFLRRCSSEQN